MEEELAGEAGQRIVTAVAAGQLTVAAGAQAFVAAAMAAQGAPGAAPAGVLVASALAGRASDGRSLETLLYLPALTVGARRAAGYSDQEAMLAGLTQMAMLAGTQIADTARIADQVACVADRRVVAYTRVVNLPACARCIILAGAQYSVTEGFLRHPRCDCTVEPLSPGQWKDVPTAQQLFDRLSPQEQQRVFTAAGARAIRDGADVGQVVNARRGMSTPGAVATAEGVTRRGVYGRTARRAGGDFDRLLGQRYSTARAPRLTPEEIYGRAGSRDEAVALLRQYAYLT
ncbi:hypothetical protein [Streptomyces sp. JJ66]|uniref:hypothetical protein n=1 Tax=Streptomyces sp. JJ66 TaxID=2803843 RepID=UPI0027E3837D|nr:hypothetical protein [Streptomyces sp. JJ66]